MSDQTRNSEALNCEESEHSNGLLRMLNSQRENGRFCDLVLHVQGKLFHAHRSVLASVSPYFNSILKKHKAVREQLTVACDNPNTFSVLLNYIYDGNPVIDQNNVWELMELADKFGIDRLLHHCFKHLRNTINLSNCLRVKNIAEKYKEETLLKESVDFIVNYLDEIVKGEEILDMNLEQFEALLSNQSIVLPKELKPTLIANWIIKDRTNREKDIVRLLSLVQWDKMEAGAIWEHFDREALYVDNDRCIFHFLNNLNLLEVPLGEKQSLYQELKLVFEESGHQESVSNVSERRAEVEEVPGEAEMELKIEDCQEEMKEEVKDSEDSNELKSRNKTAKNLNGTSSRKGSKTKNSNLTKVSPLKISLLERKRTAAQVSAALTKSHVSGTSSGEDTVEEIPLPKAHTKIRSRKGTPIKRVSRKSSENKKRILSDFEDDEDLIAIKVEPPKGKRKVGRPRKIPAELAIPEANPLTPPSETIQRKRGRPRICPRITPQDEIPLDSIQFDEEEDEIDNSSADNEENDADYHNSAPSCNIAKPLKKRGRKPLFKNGKKGFKSRLGATPTVPYKGNGKCPHCSYIEHSAIRLERHITRVHSKDINYKCTLCEFSCNWNREFYIHMKVHFNGPPYNCESCDYACDRVQLLLKHRMRHTDEKPFKCDQCKYTSRTEWNLRIHMRCHTGEKPYQCDLCGRRFSMKAGLDQHVQSHRKDRPFLCDTCGFATKYKSYLVSHMRIHLGTAFRCDYPNCEYFTPKRSQLKAHMRTHKAVRAHICAICGRGFVERSHLVRHERIHLCEKPFKCECCDYTSSRRDKLKEHVDKHHNPDVNATPKTPYKPRKPRRPKVDTSLMVNAPVVVHTPTSSNQRSEYSNQPPPLPQQTSQPGPIPNQSVQQPPQHSHTPETVLIHTPHQSNEFQSSPLIYHTQEHVMAAHHLHDHSHMVREALVYQTHKHHNPHHHPMEGSVVIQPQMVPGGHMVGHHESQPLCPQQQQQQQQQHPDLGNLHVGAFMAVY